MNLNSFKTWLVVDPINDTMTFNDTISSNCSVYPKQAIEKYGNISWLFETVSQTIIGNLGCQFHCHLQSPKECPCLTTFTYLLPTNTHYIIPALSKVPICTY